MAIDYSIFALAKGTPKQLDADARKAETATTDRKESALAKARARGQCEVREYAAFRCQRPDAHTHHLIGGLGRRNRGSSILALYKLRVCHNLPPGDTRQGAGHDDRRAHRGDGPLSKSQGGRPIELSDGSLGDRPVLRPRRLDRRAARRRLPRGRNSLFDACFRIQAEASAAARHRIPLVVENVCGAQPWVGRARWHYGSFYLWGDVPALMPIVRKASKNDGGSWFNVAHNTTSGHGQNPDGRLKADGIKGDDGGKERTHPNALGWRIPATSHKSTARKAASAHIAKIPFELARHIARAWYPSTVLAVMPAAQAEGR